MGIEIERKFLVDKEKWSRVVKPEGELYRQGYLVIEPGKTIRVRRTPKSGFITIKGATVGASRSEYEYAIPIQDAEELLDQFAVSELIKTRYKINYKNKIWEVDEFHGENIGLLVAEIELKSEDEEFEKPEWIGKEVTGEKKYYNSSLTRLPYTKW